MRVMEEDLIEIIQNVNHALSEVGKITRQEKRLILEVFHDGRDYVVIEGSQREQYIFLKGFQMLSYIHKPALLIRYGVRYLPHYNPAEFGKRPDLKGIVSYLQHNQEEADNPSIKEFAKFLKYGFKGYTRKERKKRKEVEETKDNKPKRKAKPARRKR